MTRQPIPPLPLTATAHLVPLNAMGQIDADLTCRKCTYNLRGLSAEGRCPECGTAVGWSLHGDLLQFSDPDWVEKLASGMNWIVASMLIGVLGGILGVGISAALKDALDPRGMLFLIPLAQLAFGAISLIGFWKVTAPDPAQAADSERTLSARRLVRFSITANYVVEPLHSCFEVLAFGWFLIGSSLANGLLGLVSTCASFIYARKLFLRIPDPKAARECRIVFTAFAIIMSLTLIIGIIAVTSKAFRPGPAATTTSAPFTATVSSKVTVNPSRTMTVATGTTTTGVTPPPSPIGIGTMATLGCAMGLGMVVFGLWTLRLILKLRRALNDAAGTARRTWAAIAVKGQTPL